VEKAEEEKAEAAEGDDPAEEIAGRKNKKINKKLAKKSNKKIFRRRLFRRRR